MTPKVAELLRSALSLSAAEREFLAGCLWASVDPQNELAGMTEDAIVAELDRRAAELRAAPGAGVPADEVRKMR
jgi:putative addiction module component (TIGR02574 family)